MIQISIYELQQQPQLDCFSSCLEGRSVEVNEKVIVVFLVSPVKASPTCSLIHSLQISFFK